MTPSELKSSVVRTPGGTAIHYCESGTPSRPLLICLHGLGGSTETFAPLLPYLPTSYNIILVDFQGFGKSPVSTEGPLSVAGHVSDLHYLVTSLQAATGGEPGDQKIVLIGHSLGAIVALHYAAEHTRDVAGLALLAAGRSAAHIPIVRQRMTDLARNTREKGIGFAADLAATTNFPPADKRAVPPGIRATLHAAVAASDPEGYARTCEMMVDPSHKDPDYSKITCPAMFVAGDLDGISPPERSEDLNKLVAGDSSVVLVKSGHQVILEEPEAVGEAVRHLFTKIRD